MFSRYWYAGPLTWLADSLPRPLGRLLSFAIIFVHFNGQCLFTFFLPLWFVSAAIPLLLMNFPYSESVPAVLVLLWLAAIVWWQFFRIDALQSQVKTLKIQRAQSYAPGDDDDEED